MIIIIIYLWIILRNLVCWSHQDAVVMTHSGQSHHFYPRLLAQSALDQSQDSEREPSYSHDVHKTLLPIKLSAVIAALDSELLVQTKRS